MIRHSIVAASLALAFGAAHAAQPLQLQVYNAGEGSFHANAVVVSGEHEAMVIDSGFTRADAYRIAASVLDSGKTLKTILISNADPDYYFGAEALKQLFPQVEVVASPAVAGAIRTRLAGKLAFWGPKMGANAPQQPIVPTALSTDSLSVDGEKIELRGTRGVLASRPYVWIPSLHAIAGNVALFSGLHVWTADTRQPAERQAWLAQLDEMAALKPAIVVPGHMAAGSALDASAISYTRNYLQRFDSEAGKANNAAELIAAMQRAYPQAGMGLALDIGAKVNKGEMKW